jgi:hypothetical protein
MTDKAISTLTSTGSLATTDELVLNQDAGGGSFVTKRIAVSAFKGGLGAISPRFLAYYNGTSQSNVTGNGAVYQVLFNATRINVGMLWDTTNSRTSPAPSAGIVRGVLHLYIVGPDDSTGQYNHIVAMTSGGASYFLLVAGKIAQTPGAGGGFVVSLPFEVKVSSGEYVYFTCQSAGFGANSHDIYCGSTDSYSSVSGEFIAD